MNGANRVVVLRIKRSEPVHISEVMSELLPELACRQEPAGKIEVSRLRKRRPRSEEPISARTS